MKESKIQYLDEVRLIQDWEGYGRKYEEGTVGQVFNNSESQNIFVKFGMDNGVFVPDELLERTSDIRDFQYIEDIWDEEVQPISEAEMLRALHESREDPSVKRDIYIVAIHTDSRNQEDGWSDDDDDGHEDQDTQPWEICTTTVYYVQNGAIQIGESLSRPGLVYSDVYDLDITTCGRSVHSIVKMIHNDMGITVEKIHQLYEKLRIF